MDDHTAQQSGLPLLDSPDGDMEVAFYPERMGRSGDGVVLSPSQAVQYTEDPARREAAAATAGSRQVRQPDGAPVLPPLWEHETAPLPPLEDLTAAVGDDDPFAFSMLADEPVAPVEPSGDRPGAAWAGLFGAQPVEDSDVSDASVGERWTDGAQDWTLDWTADPATGSDDEEPYGDEPLADDDAEDLAVTSPAAPARRRRATGRRGLRRRAKGSRGAEGSGDHRSALPWWEAAKPAAQGRRWPRLLRRS